MGLFAEKMSYALFRLTWAVHTYELRVLDATNIVQASNAAVCMFSWTLTLLLGCRRRRRRSDIDAAYQTQI